MEGELFFSFTNSLISVQTHNFHHSLTVVTLMVRLARAEVFDPSEVAILHLCSRLVRRCYLLGVVL